MVITQLISGLTFMAMLFSVQETLAQDTVYAGMIERHRREWQKEMLSDPRKPLSEDDFRFVHFYDPDTAFRVEATLTLLPGEIPFEVPTYSGRVKKFVRYGRLDFLLKGQPYALMMYQFVQTGNPAAANYLFVPFKDQTNGTETYGGGRYIDLTPRDIVHGKVALDFNKCYNPLCAYSDGFNCPVPPAENHLKAAIRAGEKAFGKSH